MITDLNFRQLPVPSDESQELAGEAWFYVGPRDFFPEEFGRWLGLPAPLKELFAAHHAELFATPFWQDLQARLGAGELIDIVPYAESKRLRDKT